jgi:hypothetical protein
MVTIRRKIPSQEGKMNIDTTGVGTGTIREMSRKPTAFYLKSSPTRMKKKEEEEEKEKKNLTNLQDSFHPLPLGKTQRGQSLWKIKSVLSAYHTTGYPAYITHLVPLKSHNNPMGQMSIFAASGYQMGLESNFKAWVHKQWALVDS